MAQIRIGSQKEYLRSGPGLGSTVNPVSMPAAQVIAEPEGMASGLARAALSGAGEFLKPVAQGYREAQTERVEEESLRVEREFTQFRADWTQEHKGLDARDAAQVFTQKHEELAAQAMERLDPESDEVFKSQLEKRMASQNLYALRDGLAYGQREAERHSDSVWQGQLASFNRMAAEHPEDVDAIRNEAEHLIESWQARNPGLDPTELRLKIEDDVFAKRMDTLLAQGRYDEARTVLSQAILPGQSSGIKRGLGKSIAEVFANPLNLKRVGANSGTRADYERFASDGDGFRAAWRQLKIYQNGKRGLQTPGQMISTWAPASDGNDQSSYRATVSKHSGLNLNAPIDINDPAQAARLIKGMAVQESPLGHQYTTEEIAGLLTANGGRIERERSSGGVSPARAAMYSQRLDEIERRMRAEQGAASSQALEDYFAKCKAGVIVEPPFSNAEILARFGDKGPHLVERVSREGDYAKDLALLFHMTPEAQAELVAARQPLPEDDHFAERMDTWTRLQKAVAQNQKERKEDAALYVEKHFPEVQAAAAAWLADPGNAAAFQAYKTLSSQAALSLGLPAESCGATLPKPLAALIADTVNAADNPGEHLRFLQTSLGADYTTVLSQAAPKMGLNANLYASGIPDEAVKKLVDARKNPKFKEHAEEQLGLKAAEKLAFDDDLAEELSGITSTFAAAGNEEMAHAIRENVRVLAYQYQLLNGLSPSQAITRAASEVIADRYELVKSPSGTRFRLPKEFGIDPDKIMPAYEKYIDGLDLSAILIPNSPGTPDRIQRRVYRTVLKNSATLVTNEDESGFYVFLNHTPLASKDGSPVIVKWNELVKEE